MSFLVKSLTICAAMLIGASVQAQSRITPEAFIEAAKGRTLTFVTFPGNRPVGVEQFLSGQRSVWARSDGSCTYGQITLSGLYICFEYEDDPAGQHCWVPFEHQDGMLVRSVQGSVQRVSEISSALVVCFDAPLS
ncbi:MAG: hypothetical protein ACSHWZ_16405 [Sulfitobacter sp.]